MVHCRTVHCSSSTNQPQLQYATDHWYTTEQYSSTVQHARYHNILSRASPKQGRGHTQPTSWLCKISTSYFHRRLPRMAFAPSFPIIDKISFESRPRMCGAISCVLYGTSVHYTLLLYVLYCNISRPQISSSKNTYQVPPKKTNEKATSIWYPEDWLDSVISYPQVPWGLSPIKRTGVGESLPESLGMVLVLRRRLMYCYTFRRKISSSKIRSQRGEEPPPAKTMKLFFTLTTTNVGQIR